MRTDIHRSPRLPALLVVFVLTLGLVVLAAPSAVPVGADAGDVGWEGPSYAGASGSPSGSKPQSKVWFNDGLWWATLFDAVSGDFHIWRLDVAAEAWVDTGTLVDTRPNSRSDALWSGQHLYVANHVFSESSSASGSPAQLRRYSYDATTKTYRADAGFPVAINDVRSETLVIDREPTGRLWATWVQDGQVMVAHTTTADTAWSTPFALPVAGTAVSSDDISAVVAYRSDRIGIMWSNQDDETMSFTSHLTSDPPTTWSTREIAYSGTSAADDHIDFAAVQDINGRVLAAVKTSRSGSAVLVHLLDRNATTGTWTSHPYGLGTDNHTRPIAVVDSEHQQVHMYATSGQAGGSIYAKTAPLSAIDFPPGTGTPVLTDASTPDINNATSTKQTVSSTTGIVVIATNDTTRRYWTHYDPLDGPGPTPTTPTASFTRTPTTGTAPLQVAFTDTSTGTPTSWAWTFGDGTTSTTQHPTHTYTTPGTYTVTLTATNTTGSHTTTQTGSITVTAPPDAAASFVAAAFVDLLGRAPTADELDRHVGSLHAGGTRATLARDLVTRDEWLGTIVTDLYRDTLGRDPDPAGLTYWVARLRSGQSTVTAATAAFYASPEHFDGLGGGTIPTWVDHLYQEVLLRPPDPDGQAYWVDRTTRLGRTRVAAELHRSLESRQTRVTELYRALLARDPDADGLAYWSGRHLVQGDLALAVSLVASAEYLARAQTRFP